MSFSLLLLTTAGHLKLRVSGTSQKGNRMTIVTYHKQTREVISVVPIDIEHDEEAEVELEELDGITKDGYDYIIYNGTEPLFENDRWVMKLVENKLILNEGYLRD